MARFAQNTEVSVEKSRAEIETILARYGASHFAYMTGPGTAVIAFQAKDRRIRFDLPLPDRADKKFARDGRGSIRTMEKRYAAWEQACRQSWRALALVIKAKLEAVESGITEFENEFMAHIVMPDGLTAAQHVRPWIASAYQGGDMPALLPPTRSSS